MKAAIAFGGLLLFAACRPTENGSTRPSSETSPQQPTPSVAGTGHDTNGIAHFWFAYPFQPQPGNRVWINVAQTNWIEVYPDGSQSRYRLLSREMVDGLTGVVVSKTAGDVQVTDTLNDGSFQAFLPDKTNSKIVLYFRNKMNDQWQPWRPLAQMNPIE